MTTLLAGSRVTMPSMLAPEAREALRERQRVYARFVENSVVNAARASGLYRADRGTALHGIPAVIVGAGPSLDRAIDFLRDVREHVCIVSTNTATPALLRAGITPHVVAAIEQVDVSPQVASAVQAGAMLALGWGAHPSLWALPATARLSLVRSRTGTLGGTWYPAGGVSIAATALAIAWGGPIVLVGMDHALAGDRAYAAGTAWQDFRYSERGGDLVGEGHPERDALHRAIGATGFRRETRRLLVPAWGGRGEVATTADLDCSRRGLETLAASAPTAIVNATGGGAAIAGTAERDLAAVQAELLARPRAALDLAGHPTVSVEEVAALQNRMASDFGQISQAAHAGDVTAIFAAAERSAPYVQWAIFHAAAEEDGPIASFDLWQWRPDLDPPGALRTIARSAERLLTLARRRAGVAATR